MSQLELLLERIAPLVIDRRIVLVFTAGGYWHAFAWVENRADRHRGRGRTPFEALTWLEHHITKTLRKDHR